jgi:mercuric ion transport protein
VKIELIYDHDCPNAEKARNILREACLVASIAAEWQELERGAADSPAYAQKYGSPTILVNDQDVMPAAEMKGDGSCRLYPKDTSGYQGVPSVDSVIQAIQNNGSVYRKWTWKRLMALIPVIGTALMPKLTCPACWPAYAGFLGIFGIRFVNYTPYLLPMTLAFLVIVLASLAYRAKQRRGFSPFLIGVVGSVILSVGKFNFDSDGGMYIGLAIIMAASLWNTWPKRSSRKQSCPACEPNK